MKLEITKSDNIQILPSKERHECKSRRKNEWIIFRCQKCEEYEYWINTITGKVISSANTYDKRRIQHFGRFVDASIYVNKGENADKPNHKKLQQEAKELISILKASKIADSQDDISSLGLIADGYFNNEAFAGKFMDDVKNKYKICKKQQ